ncbi:MAG: hypothetical protein NVSMB3_09140 [Acidobacteriaceae bacterium]
MARGGRATLEGADYAGGQKEEGGDELEGAADDEADEAEGEKEQPDEGVEKESQEGEGPTEEEEDAPEDNLDHVFGSVDAARQAWWGLRRREVEEDTQRAECRFRGFGVRGPFP